MPATSEDIIRDLLRECTATVRPPASIATEVVVRQRRRDRRRVVSAVATGAALGTAASVMAVLSGHSSRGPGVTRPVYRLTADQRVLYGLSSAAAKQPQGKGRYAVMSTEGDHVKDTSVIDSVTGSMWSYQEGSDGYPSATSFSPHYSPTSAQFAAMPTGLAALRPVLIAQWDEQNKPVRDPLRTKEPTPVPRPLKVTADDKVFQQASYMLWNPLVSSALRSALYKVLAAVPGVTVNPSARDSIGRPAVEISRVDNSGFPGGRSDRIIFATYENHATGAVLESTVTYPPGDMVTSQDPHGTRTVVDTTVYLRTTRVSAIPADPYGG